MSAKVVIIFRYGANFFSKNFFYFSETTVNHKNTGVKKFSAPDFFCRKSPYFISHKDKI
jgi:hypothetical protein